MKKKLFFPCFLLAAAVAFGQTVPVNLAVLPDSLKKGAAVIVHSENISYEVESLDEARLKVQRVFTVMSEEGKSSLVFNEYNTKYVSLTDAEIKVYDAAGKQVAKHKKKDMLTTAVGDGLIEDGYVTFFQVPATGYPLTVEVAYEQRFRGTLTVPDYHFLHPKEAVVQSNFTAKLPSEIKLRYKAKQCAVEPSITDDGKYTVYKWSVGNRPVFEDEEGSLSLSARFPSVRLVSNQFSHYGYRGDLSSWKSFGAWIGSLYEGLDALSPERQQFFQQLVKEATDDREKARRIYRYLQENFRYVSIQLGIGGLRPFPASFTDQKKYGDCKGLSLYMKAALKAVGVRSHVAIINAGYNEEPVDVSFPANGFNHVIVCVPGKDSIWLECTSQTAGFNQLGSFTENRNALLVTEEGGVLVSTPKSEAASNTITTRTTVTIDRDLVAVMQSAIQTTGEFAQMMAAVIKDKKDEQKQFLVSYLGYKQPDDFVFTAKETNEAHVAELKTAVHKLHEFSAGSKYFFSPRVQKIWTAKLPAADSRKLDFYFRYPFIKRDTTVLIFPEGFAPEVVPTEKKLEMAYGSYQSKTWYHEGEKAFYTATTLELKRHQIPAADYKKVKAFFDEVAGDEAQKIVVKRGEVKAEEKKGF